MTDTLQTFDPPPSRMSEEAFVARFGGVYEHSPWIAESAWQRGLGNAQDTVDGLSGVLMEVVADATADQQLALIRAHPDLAGRAAVRGELTHESTDEQASARLDQCTPAEFARFEELNGRYRERFEFPFVMAVKGSNRHLILAAFEERLHNDASAERACALREIHKIARLRLADIAAAAPEESM